MPPVPTLPNRKIDINNVRTTLTSSALQRRTDAPTPFSAEDPRIE
jgi:hypothetical protein